MLEQLKRKYNRLKRNVKDYIFDALYRNDVILKGFYFDEANRGTRLQVRKDRPVDQIRIDSNRFTCEPLPVFSSFSEGLSPRPEYEPALHINEVPFF